MEIKHCVGITCKGFEEKFMALLIAIEAGYVHFNSHSSLNFGSKRERELKRLTWAMNDVEEMSILCEIKINIMECKWAE